MKPWLSRLATALVSCACLVVACTTTAGEPADVRLVFESLSDGHAVTPTGWEVTLETAAILLGPVYGYAPLDEMALVNPFAPSVARAHGGFDPLSGRTVRLEHLEQTAFDALSTEPVDVGLVTAFGGSIDELSLVLDEPRGANTATDGPTRGHHVYVRGTASRDEATVVFEATLDLEDVDLTRHVDGVTVSGDAPPLADGVVVVVGVDPARWLSEASFDGLDTSGAMVALDASTQPHRALRLGVRTASAYGARVERSDRE